MNISDVTQYISDTAANILSSDPASTRVGVATDTDQLFISDGTKWTSQSSTNTFNKPWALATGDILSQTPLLQFDASLLSSLTNNTGNAPSVGDPIAIWKSLRNNSQFIEKRAINQPTYSTNATSRNTAGVLFDGVSNMSIDRSMGSLINLPITVFTVYTPTRDSRTMRVHDGSSSTTVLPGGRYSRSELGNHTNYVWSNRELRGQVSHNATYFSGCIELSHQHSNQYEYQRIGTSINNSITYPQYNYSAGDLFDHRNNNFLGKTQIHVFQINQHEFHTLRQPYIDVINTHLTWSPVIDSDKAYEVTTQYTDRGFNMNSIQLGNQSSYNTVHELMIFNQHLPQHELGMIGAHLFDKWCDTDQTLLKFNNGIHT
jgi:hypothetical protein